MFHICSLVDKAPCDRTWLLLETISCHHDLCSTHKNSPHSATGHGQLKLAPPSTKSWCHKLEPKSWVLSNTLHEKPAGQPRPKPLCHCLSPPGSAASLWVQGTLAGSLVHHLPIYTSSNDPYFLLHLPLQLFLLLLGMVCFLFFSYSLLSL